MDLNEKSLGSKTKYRGKILYVTSDNVLLPNGDTSERDVVHHSGGVGILPLLDDGNVLCVKQFRYPMHRVLLEIPAGKKEKGEKPLECGIRELHEETGYKSNKITPLGEILPTPAYDTETIHIYLAENLEKISDQELDKDEFINVCKVPFSELLKMVMNDEIKDAKTVAAVLKTAFIKNYKL